MVEVPTYILEIEGLEIVGCAYIMMYEPLRFSKEWILDIKHAERQESWAT